MTTVSVRTGTITQTGEPILIVESPYHPDFAPSAKALGGRWSATQRQWRFDPRDAERVRELCREIYGTSGDPAETADTVTISARALDRISADCTGIYLAGRSIACATGRDSGARPGGGVIHTAGPGPRSGGSVKNWTTVIPEGCELEIRDLPRAAVDAALAASSPQWEITLREDVPTQAEVRAHMGQGMAASELERIWTSIQALPETDQVTLRNRLLEAL